VEEEEEKRMVRSTVNIISPPSSSPKRSHASGGARSLKTWFQGLAGSCVIETEA
jgi:hypothetical protein